MFKFLIKLANFFFIGIFLIFFPLIFILSRLRKFFKKVFHLKPTIIYAPIGIPMVFLACQADQKQGFRAETFCFEVPRTFRSLNADYVLKDHRLALKLNYLTDYLLIFLKAIFSYDIFQYSFSGGFLCGSHLRTWELPILKILGKIVIVFAYGADSRLPSVVKKFKYNTYMDAEKKDMTYSEAEIRMNIQLAQKYADLIIGGSDLVFFGPKMIVLPVVADLSALKPLPFKKNANKKRLTIIFPTGHHRLKGGRFIFSVMEKLKKKYPINFLFIHNLTYREVLEKYHQADIFIEDVISGWYGQTTVEAMALARPVICYLRKDIIKEHAFYAQGMPVVNANPDNLEKALILLIKNPQLRRELAKRGRQFVEIYHHPDFLGFIKAYIYQKLWQGKSYTKNDLKGQVKQWQRQL